MTLLKRYANRRLYDTRISRYITLEEMAHRIRKGEDFRVQDAQTDEDLTRKVLMQIILLESLDIAELLPLEFLQLLIRVRERGVQELFVRYLKVTMEAFSLANRQLEDNVRLVQQQVSVTAHLMRKLIPLSRSGHGEAHAGAHGTSHAAADSGGDGGSHAGARADVDADADVGAGAGADVGADVEDALTSPPVVDPEGIPLEALNGVLPEAEEVLFEAAAGSRRGRANRRRRV